MKLSTLFSFKNKTPEVKVKSVFKYRFGDEKTFKRDLDDLEMNRFYLPSYDCLNDPCETIVLSDLFHKQADSLARVTGKPIDFLKKAMQEVIEKKNNLGIYSLSKSYKHELLWAHYANSHYGFCIEYDLDILLNSYKNDSEIYSFPVIYSLSPPQIALNDSQDKNVKNIIKKIAGTKSTKWSYEEEQRIITDQFGHRNYYYQALKSIYFGLRMPDERKQEMMSRLKGRGIDFFQMTLQPKSYNLVANQIEDLFGKEVTYFTKIPSEITGSLPIKYAIIERNYFWIYRKAKITIELESKVNEESLLWLGNLIRKDLFSQADRVFMFYNVKGLDNHGACWASSHFENGEIKVAINDFSWLEE